MSLHPAADPPGVRPSSEHHLAVVVAVKNVHRTGRVSVRLLSYDAAETQDAPIEARLCVPFAGRNRGAFMVPDVNDEVLVTFLNGDPRQAVVLGGLWNGRNMPQEQLGGDGERVDRWTLVGKRGTRVAIVEEDSGARIRLSTSDRVFCEITEAGGGKIELQAGGTTVTIDSSGLNVDTPGDFQINSASSRLTCSTVDVTAGQSTFSGQVMASAVQSPSVVGGTYSPGGGNVW
jgi:uncharacterized protein involved in type VI secretion and phage assembly